MALVNYMSPILVELIKLANLIVNVTRSLACLSRINAVFDQEAGMREGSYTGEKGVKTGTAGAAGADSRAADLEDGADGVPVVEVQDVSMT